MRADSGPGLNCLCRTTSQGSLSPSLYRQGQRPSLGLGSITAQRVCVAWGLRPAETQDLGFGRETAQHPRPRGTAFLGPQQPGSSWASGGRVICPFRGR